jgi:hypothetical protein
MEANMAETHSNGGGEKSRLDRLEGLMELLIDDHLQFQQEHKQLLTAQVLLTDEVRKLAEAQRHTDERMNGLISVVDGLVRNRPPQ